MSRYLNKVKEIESARNSSATALKVRGIKWNKNQKVQIMKFAAQEIMPTKESLRKCFPLMSENKLDAMLNKVKFYRKKLASEMNLENVDGVRNSKGNGFVYLVENEMFPGWIKCGMTTNLASRINTYNTNDPLRRFKLISDKKVIDRRLSEKNLIRELGLSASLVNGEWFRIDKDHALNIFQKM
jgi:hypothetical protein